MYCLYFYKILLCTLVKMQHFFPNNYKLALKLNQDLIIIQLIQIHLQHEFIICKIIHQTYHI